MAALTLEEFLGSQLSGKEVEILKNPGFSDSLDSKALSADFDIFNL